MLDLYVPVLIHPARGFRAIAQAGLGRRPRAGLVAMDPLHWPQVAARRLERNLLVTPSSDARPADVAAAMCGTHALRASARGPPNDRLTPFRRYGPAGTWRCGVAGVWRQRRTPRKLAITLEPFADLRPSQLDELEGQVSRLGEIWDTPAELTLARVG